MEGEHDGHHHRAVEEHARVPIVQHLAGGLPTPRLVANGNRRAGHRNLRVAHQHTDAVAHANEM
eukprot:scaffold14402_cov30-Tisochrysis_lutea.AAC.3